jgi:protein-disulfide isomerase
MASREDEKKRAREEREARADEDAKADRRKRRLRMLAIALGAAAAVVVIAIVVSSSGGGSSSKKSSGGQQAGPVVGAQTVNKTFTGIPENGFAVGNAKAPVTLVEFADLQCPFCKQATDASLPTLIDRYVRPGKVRIEFRNFAILGEDSKKAARALAGAAAQNKAWPFIELWYLNQGQENSGYVTDAFIGRIAGAVDGLDAAKVVAASNDTGNDASLGVANTEAQKFGIQSTPSYLIGRTGSPLQQLQLSTLDDPAQFTGPIDQLLGGQ